MLDKGHILSLFPNSFNKFKSLLFIDAPVVCGGRAVGGGSCVGTPF